MKKIIVIMAVLAIAGTANAATEDEKQAAIDAGLTWLANNQLGTGAWSNNGNVSVGANAATGSALLAFLEEGYRAGTNVVIGGTDHGDVVGDGLDYLFGKAQLVSISNQTAGNPDGDGNGYGVRFDRYTTYGGTGSGSDIYTTGIVASALAKTGTPGAVVDVPGSSVHGWTHAQVVQNVTDYFAYGQADSGSSRGGWRYTANGGADNSTAQWGAISGLFASGIGIDSPDFVKEEMQYWIDYVQYHNTGHYLDGSSGYTGPLGYNNEAKTGGLLAEMIFAEEDLYGVAYDLDHPDVQAALDYLKREWDDEPSGTWYGNFGHPYAMWSVYKGLELTIGLDDSTWLDAGDYYYNPATVTLDDGDTYTWWEDYCEYLVNTQVGGTWGGYSNWQGALSTGWYINILAATEIPTEEVPVPAAFLLGGLGLAVSSWRLRRRKEL